MRMCRGFAVLAVAGLLLEIGSAQAVAGALDPTFGTAGTVTIVGARGDAAVLQPDGKIVVAGVGTNASASPFSIARYNRDASPDTGFGVSGTARGGDGSA